MSDLERPTAEPAPPPQSPPVWNPAPVHAPPPPPRKSRAGAFFFGAFSGCLLVVAGFVVLMVLIAVRGDDDDINFASEKIAVVPIEGEILDARDTLDLLHKYARNANV